MWTTCVLIDWSQHPPCFVAGFLNLTDFKVHVSDVCHSTHATLYNLPPYMDSSWKQSGCCSRQSLMRRRISDVLGMGWFLSVTETGQWGLQTSSKTDRAVGLQTSSKTHLILFAASAQFCADSPTCPVISRGSPERYLSVHGLRYSRRAGHRVLASWFALGYSLIWESYVPWYNNISDRRKSSGSDLLVVLLPGQGN